MEKRTLQVRIDKEGNYTIETMEGFSGTLCTEKTQELVVAIGGDTVDESKKPEYYDGDKPPVFITG